MSTIFNIASGTTLGGTPDSDTIIVQGSNNKILGFGGNDVIFDVGEANVLYGDSTVTIGPNSGLGEDVLIGGIGSDTLWGGFGAE